MAQRGEGSYKAEVFPSSLGAHRKYHIFWMFPKEPFDLSLKTSWTNEKEPQLQHIVASSGWMDSASGNFVSKQY
jgi:hypothetical protein